MTSSNDNPASQLITPSESPRLETYDDSHVKAFVDAHNIKARVFRLGVPTPTVQAAADTLDTVPERIIKSLIFVADGEPYVVIAAGTTRIDDKKVAKALDISRRKLRFAKPDDALAISGYVVGSMPPFAHRSPFPALVDSLSINTTAPHEVYFAGAGRVDAMMELSLEVLLTVIKPHIVPLSKDT
ncbi:MAG: YbaK/EbsC family protein [Deinococcota bacterium]